MLMPNKITQIGQRSEQCDSSHANIYKLANWAKALLTKATEANLHMTIVDNTCQSDTNV